MTKLQKLGRLFTIKTRLEAFLITYAIAIGSVERGFQYMQNYPGNGGVLLALACLGVPFIAGAKLLDSVRPNHAIAVQTGNSERRLRPRRISRSRPKDRRLPRDSASPSLRHTD